MGFKKKVLGLLLGLLAAQVAYAPPLEQRMFFGYIYLFS
jgi:hypothetical protein